MPFFPLAPVVLGADSDCACANGQTRMDELQSAHSAEMSKLHKQVGNIYAGNK